MGEQSITCIDAKDVAVRLAGSPEQLEKLGEFLASRGWSDARRFLPKDDDELNDRLCRGEFAAVVFAAPESAMEMVWAGHGSVRRWNAGLRGTAVEVCFAFGPNSEADWHNVLRRMEISFADWERRRTRRQLIAACILTTVALVAMGVLLWSRG